jgi:hypothetical protein
MSFPKAEMIICWSAAIAALPFTVMNARLAGKPSMGGIRRTPVAGSADGESAPAEYVAVTTLREKRGFPAGKMNVVDIKKGIASKIGIAPGNRHG